MNFATSDGTGKDGIDYTASSGTLTWTNGVTGDRTFQVPLIDDDTQNSSRSVNLTLSNLVTTGGAVMGTPLTAIILISDNDGVQQQVEEIQTNGGCSFNPENSQTSFGFVFGLPLVFWIILSGRSRRQQKN